METKLMFISALCRSVTLTLIRNRDVKQRKSRFDLRQMCYDQSVMNHMLSAHYIEVFSVLNHVQYISSESAVFLSLTEVML